MPRRSNPHVRYVTVHGHRRAYVRMGSGPALLLLHGLACDHTTWDPVMESLARTHTVIAPDLLGHGQSDKPRADYSVGGYANGMRDLLTVLGIDSATVVGHSFGGGVAMQFAYQYPERTERLVLVGSGGLGPDVSPAIRAITTPGFQQVMGVLSTPGAAPRHDGGDAAALADRREPAARPRRGRRHLRLVQGPAHPRGDPPRRAGGRGLEGPDRHDGRSRLPHRGDADVRRVGRRRPGHPGRATPATPARSRPPPASRSSPTPATSRTRTTPSGS